MTVSHLCGTPQLLAAAISVVVVSVAVRERADRILAAGLFTAGFALEMLRISSVPAVSTYTNHVVAVTGVVTQPVRHTSPYWSSDLPLTAEESGSSQLRIRLVVPDSLGGLEEGCGIGARGRFAGLTQPRNPGQTDWDSSFRRRGGIGTVWADSIWPIDDLNDESWRPRARIRFAIESMVDRVIGTQEGALALAVLVGVRDGIDRETFDNFREAGIIHILAISGLHVLVVVGLLFKLGQLLLPGYRLPALFTLCGLGAYVYLVGPQASVVRAGIMGAAVLLGLVLNRRSDPTNSIGLAGVVLLVFNPRLLWEPGFQLSFSATLGILLITPTVVGLLGKVPRFLKWLMSAMAASLGAQLAVFPFVLYHFHQWPSYGLLTNIPAVLLLTVLLWTALAALLVGVVWPSAALFLGYGTQWSAQALKALARITASVPGATNTWGAAVTWILVVVWCSVMGALLGRKNGRHGVGMLVGILLGINGWLLWSVLSPWETSVERVLLLHVRGGNCIVLEQPGSQFSVIDPGAPGRSRAAYHVADAYMRFRRGHVFHSLLATSTSKYRMGAAGLLTDEDLVTETIAPSSAGRMLEKESSSFAPWREGGVAALGSRFRAVPLGVNPSELDGLLIESRGGIRVLVSGEGDWKADARLSSRSDMGTVDVLYVGPSRTTGPSHLLLRRTRPNLIVLGDSRKMESGLVERLLSSGYKVACTERGAAIIECRGRTIIWWQWQ
jgi:ComEC/Rec2-related protein